MQAAQASNNVPAKYEPARLRRPTTPLPRRGCPIGLGVNLSVSAAEPATELPTVARAAPAKVLATSRQICIARYAGWLTVHARRHPREVCPLARGVMSPSGSTPIRSITGRPSLPPSSCTRSPIGWPYDLPTPRGGLRAYHVPQVEQGWVRSCLYAGGSTSTPDEFGASGPGHAPFGPGVSASCACSRVTALSALHLG
jgi:hypothetical protein